MGPLVELVGTWEGSFGKSFTSVPRWAGSSGVNNGQNTADPWSGWSGSSLRAGLAMIPGKPTARVHPMKQQTYRERIVFTPVRGVVRNRGYESGDHVNPGCEADQTLIGVDPDGPARFVTP